MKPKLPASLSSMRRKLHHLHYRLQVTRRRHVRRARAIGRHPFTIPASVFLALVLLAAISFWLFTRAGNTLEPAGNDIVIISHDHIVQTVPSHEPTVGALLEKLKIVVNTGDVVEPAADTPIHQDDFRINIYRAAPVKVLDNTKPVFAYSAATTPRSVAAQAGLKIYPEDSLGTQPVENFLQERALGSVVVISRSVPVKLSINGYVADTRTRAGTVEAFLKEKGITLGKTGKVRPALGAPIRSNLTVSVIRDGTGIQSVTKPIAMPVKYINDGSLAYGTFAIRQAGSAGERVQTYQVTVRGGKVVSSKLLQDVVTQDAITQIVVRGTSLSGIKGDMALAGISPNDYQYVDYIVSHESGWCPTKAQGQVGYCPVYSGYVPSYGGYGLCQSTPGSKMASAGSDWATNPITQLRWCDSYAVAHYGTWAAAYSHWIAYRWW